MNDQRTASAIYSLWWQIALGIFIALCAHSIVEAAYARYQLQQLNAQLETEFNKIRPSISSPRPITEKPVPLRPGERCIQGRRFQRVDNGWQQVNTPC